MLTPLLIIVGLIFLIKGEIKVTNSITLKALPSRVIGGAFILSGVLAFGIFILVNYLVIQYDLQSPFLGLLPITPALLVVLAAIIIGVRSGSQSESKDTSKLSKSFKLLLILSNVSILFIIFGLVAFFGALCSLLIAQSILGILICIASVLIFAFGIWLNILGRRNAKPDQ